MTRVLRTLFGFAAILLLTSAHRLGADRRAQRQGCAIKAERVLPGVTVTVTNTATGLTRTVVTDGDGAYIVSNLPPGPYRLEATLQGFRTYAQTGIVLQVGGTPTHQRRRSALGDLAETVTVEAAAPLVDVRSAGISEVVENERIVELPLQGRQVTDLIVLAGAAVQTSAPTPPARPRAPPRSRSRGGLVVSASATFSTAPCTTTPYNNLNLPLPFPGRAAGVQRGDERTLRAERRALGRVGQRGDQVGHQPLSGNAFEFLRDHRFNATNPFAAVGPDGKRQDDGLRRNQFGGTLGGPIVQRQDLLLRRVPGHADAPDAGGQHRVGADRGDAGRRLHGVHLAGVQRRPADRAARAVREQPARSRAVQPRRAEDRAEAADARPIRAARSPTARRADEQRVAGGGEGRLPDRRRTTRCSAGTCTRLEREGGVAAGRRTS